MIEVFNIKKSFGKNVVLNGVTFSLKNGEFVGLVGPSGGGKSVLLKILGGIIEADQGQVHYEDQPLQAHDDLRVGFLFQEGALFDSMTVLENVSFPLFSKVVRPSTEFRNKTYAKAASLLSDVGLAAASKKYPGQLSGGMRRRVGIARALVADPQVVFLDDPTGGLDPVAASTIMNLLKELHKRYSPTIIMVSHDIRRLLPNVDRILGLFNGKIVCDLPPKKIPSDAPARVLEFLSTRYDFPQEVSAG